METKKRKKRSNIIMVAMIAVIAFCGVMAVGNIKGWFGGSDSYAAVEKVKGTVNIERDGVGYRLEDGTDLRQGDIVETGGGSEVALSLGSKGAAGLNENTEIAMKECSKGNIKLELSRGEVFADMSEDDDGISMTFGENSASTVEAVFSVSSQQGSDAINLYSGEVSVTAADGSEKTVKSGESMAVIEGADGALTVEVNKLQAAALSNYMLDKLQSCEDSESLCFSQAEIKKVAKDRTREDAMTASESTDVITTTSGKASPGKSSSGSDASKDYGTCTITIRCNTILNNMGRLKPGKERYVPSNGIILATSTVEFKKGETVFDVLKRACSYAGIPLEYSYTPLYESYYIEGINNLYEFDCGAQSGWMYKVNGWFPNYGCSSYTLKNGDNIVWDYTCEGLGADVGGSVM